MGSMDLPPGATLVDNGPKLPPGATLVSGNPPSTSASTGSGLADLAAGVGGSFAQHVVNVYDLIRKVPGLDKLLPDSSEVHKAIADATPKTEAAHTGGTLESIGEFAVPAAKAEMALASFGRLARIAGGAGVGAGVSAVQSGGDAAKTAEGAGLGAAGPVIGDLAGWAGNKLLSPSSLYQSALKPTRALIEEHPNVVDAGLQARLPVSPGSLAKIHEGIEDLRNQINAGVQANPGTVDPAKVVGALDELRNIYATSANPTLGGGVDTIDAVRDSFLRAHGAVPRGQSGTTAQPMSLPEAQQMKINTYKTLRNAYGDMKGAEVEATKQLARGLKEQIETVFPEIAGMNQKQSELMGLDDAMSRAVWRIENRNMVPLTAQIAGAGGHPGVGMVASALDMPELKSRLAIALSTMGVKNPGQFIQDRLANVATAAAQAQTSKPAETVQ